MAAKKKRRAAGATKAAPAFSPSGHAMWPRRGEPGAEYAKTPISGPSVSLHADEAGMVRLSTSEQVQFADELSLPAWVGSPTPETSTEAPAEGEEV